MRNELGNAIADITEVMKFESWLRFYFIEEEANMLFIRIPQKSMEKIKADYKELAPLAEKINNEEINYEKSVSAVCGFLIDTLDGPKYNPGVVQQVFDHDVFQMEMNLFNTWQQAHEEQLDGMFLDFGKFMELFEEWKNSEDVKQYFEEMKSKGGAGMSCATGKVQ